MRVDAGLAKRGVSLAEAFEHALNHEVAARPGPAPVYQIWSAGQRLRDFGPVAQACAILLVMWGMCYWLYRRGSSSSCRFSVAGENSN